MIRYDRNLRVAALCFAALAGFVDSIGFLKSGGLFVSFMSGNSTRLAVGIVQATTTGLAAAALIALFVLGVTLNVLVASSIFVMHRKVTATAGVAALLLAAASFQSLGWDLATIAALCLAMGASNTIFQREGEVSIGVTYMTGTLVRLGHRLADAARGGSRTAWISYLLLWLSLVLGGIVGAVGYSWSATASLWLAALLAIGLVGVVKRLTMNLAS